ncbi:MAG: T9SS C-terminal target domain-containing protein, partial [Bacteroidetes bacterium]
VKSVSNLATNITKIDVSDLPAGNYFVKINGTNAVSTKKIVKF